MSPKQEAFEKFKLAPEFEAVANLAPHWARMVDDDFIPPRFDRRTIWSYEEEIRDCKAAADAGDKEAQKIMTELLKRRLKE